MSNEALHIERKVLNYFKERVGDRYQNKENKFSIINVDKSEGSKVSGNWVQDHLGTLESALEKARKINAANSDRLDLAIVKRVEGTTPMLEYFTNLTRLN